MPGSVGTAYLTLVPKLDSSFKGKAEADMKAAGKGSGSGFGASFGSALKSIAAAGVVIEAGRAVGQSFVEAFQGAAQREQLVGGVETLFGDDAAAIVQANAAKAFETAGISANTYMEQATSFSASLISSLKGDTVAAASVADTAMRDMSDNANKMGSDIESIQNAYQGFAKGNFTMLDNLKLGYGGTKTEMEKLLADAQKISGVKYNIDNFADITEAIHVMQTEMGIANATYEESKGTVEGSLNKMKAAWSDFLSGMGSGGDMASLATNLMTSFTDVMQNIVPLVMQIFQGLVESLPTIIEQLIPILTDLIVRASEMLPTLIPLMLSAAQTLFMGIVNAIPVIVPALLSAIMSMLHQGYNAITSFDLGSAGQALIDGLVAGLSAAGGAVADMLMNIARGAVDAFKRFFGIASPSKLMRQMGGYITGGLAGGIGEGEGDVLQTAGRLNDRLFDTFGGKASSGLSASGSQTGNTYIINGLEWTNDAKIENAMMTIFGGLQRLGAM